MKKLSIILTLFGVVCLFFGGIWDTTFRGHVNFHAVSQQQALLLLGGFTFLGGLILLGLENFRVPSATISKKEPEPTDVVANPRACPYCLNQIEEQTTTCKYCEKELPERVRAVRLFDIGDGEARVSGIENGDVVYSYGGQRIKSCKELRMVMQSMQGRHDAVLVRGGKLLRTTVLAGPLGALAEEVSIDKPDRTSLD